MWERVGKESEGRKTKERGKEEEGRGGQGGQRLRKGWGRKGKGKDGRKGSEPESQQIV